MLKKIISKILFIKKCNLALIYYKNGKVTKITSYPSLIEQAREEGILIVE